MHLPKAIAALPKWADDEPSQYSLECVRLKHHLGWTFAEACDGRRLCRLTWTNDAEHPEYHLEGKSLARGLRTAGATPSGYTADLNGQVTVRGKKAEATVATQEVERWPRTEDVLYAPDDAQSTRMMVYPLRELARTAIKAAAKGKVPSLALSPGGVSVKLDARYVRDMAETAIQCGYETVEVSATTKHNAVHFRHDGDLLLEAVIMPLAED